MASITYKSIISKSRMQSLLYPAFAYLPVICSQDSKGNVTILLLVMGG